LNRSLLSKSGDYPVVLETEEQMLEREQNDRDVLESIDKTQ
jgi:hypothetical protein